VIDGGKGMFCEAPGGIGIFGAPCPPIPGGSGMGAPPLDDMGMTGGIGGADGEDGRDTRDVAAGGMGGAAAGTVGATVAAPLVDATGDADTVAVEFVAAGVGAVVMAGAASLVVAAAGFAAAVAVFEVPSRTLTISGNTRGFNSVEI
jgi:hypothetical protein